VNGGRFSEWLGFEKNSRRAFYKKRFKNKVSVMVFQQTQKNSFVFFFVSCFFCRLKFAGKN